MCGFAWVTVKPANSALAKAMKARFGGHNAYGGGLAYWISMFDQSMTKKEAYARAFAAVLKDAGFDRVYANSRMD